MKIFLHKNLKHENFITRDFQIYGTCRKPHTLSRGPKAWHTYVWDLHVGVRLQHQVSSLGTLRSCLLRPTSWIPSDCQVLLHFAVVGNNRRVVKNRLEIITMVQCTHTHTHTHTHTRWKCRPNLTTRSSKNPPYSRVINGKIHHCIYTPCCLIYSGLFLTLVSFVEYSLDMNLVMSNHWGCSSDRHTMHQHNCYFC